MPTPEEIAAFTAEANKIIDAQVAADAKIAAEAKAVADAKAAADAKIAAADAKLAAAEAQLAEAAAAQAAAATAMRILEKPTDQPLRTAGLPDIGNVALAASAGIVERVDSLVAKLTTRAAEIDAQAAAKVESIVETMRPYYEDTTEDGRTLTRAVDKSLAEKKAAQAVEPFRREQRVETERLTAPDFAAIAALQAQLESVSGLFGSSVELLSRVGLGSSERATYAMQIANAGESEIKNLAAYAIATGNRMLAAAVLAQANGVSFKPEGSSDRAAENARLKRTSWTLLKRGLADAICGDDWRKVTDAIKLAKAKLEDATMARSRYVTGSPTAQTIARDKITQGLRDRDRDADALARREAVAKAHQR